VQLYYESLALPLIFTSGVLRVTIGRSVIELSRLNFILDLVFLLGSYFSLIIVRDNSQSKGPG